MSTWEVGVKSGQNYTNILFVEGVSHIVTEQDDWDRAQVNFFSKKTGTNPVTKTQDHKSLLTVPYSELVYYKRLPKKEKKNG